MPEVTIGSANGAGITIDDGNYKQLADCDLHLSTDGTKAVFLYREGEPREPEKGFLKRMVSEYGPRIFGGPGGAALREILPWPEEAVEHQGRFGLVAPALPPHFFFGKDTNLAEATKSLGWFVSARNFNKYLPDADRGELIGFMRSAVRLCRAVRVLHAAGLSHLDLSSQSCLADPAEGQAMLLTIGRLAEPGLEPFSNLQHPRYAAPEIVAASGPDAPGPIPVPGPEANRHSLAVLVYQLLFHRHPLLGSKVLDPDPAVQERLELGEKALFVEHPSDRSNVLRITDADRDSMPWLSPAHIPLEVMGPRLRDLFLRAFVDGLLHAPGLRPTPREWERALVAALDLLLKCERPGCPKGWYVLPAVGRTACPYCGTPHRGDLAYVDFYRRQGTEYESDGCRLIVRDGLYLYPWHVDPTIFPDESLSEADRKPVAYFQFHNGKWLFVNNTLEGLTDAARGREIPPGKFAELAHGSQLAFNRGERAAVFSIFKP